MTEVAIQVTAESNVSELFTRDAEAVSAASASMTAAGGKVSVQNTETSSSFEGLGSAAKAGQDALSSVSGEMGELVDKAAELAKGLVEDGASMGGIATAGAAVVGVWAELGASGAGLVNQISQVSAVTGMSIEQTDFWGNALADVGGNVNSLVMVNRLLTNSMESLNSAQSAGNPLTQKQSDLLKELGGSVTGADGQVKTFAAALPQLVTNLAGVTDAQERARIGTEIFGRSWGQISMLVTNWTQVAAAAKEQSDRLAAGFEDGGAKAVQYDIAMNNLKITYDQLALSALPAFTVALKSANVLFQAATSDLNPVMIGYHGVNSAIEQVGHGFDMLGLSSHHASAGLDEVTAAANGEAGAAANAKGWTDNYAASLSALDQHLAGLAPQLTDTTLNFSKLTQGEEDSIRSAAAHKAATDAAWAALAQSNDVTDKAITAEHNAELASKAAAEAKRDESAATAAAALTVQGQVDLLYKQASATAIQTEAQREYNAEMGITVDVNGQVIRSMDEMITSARASILQSDRMSQATAEAKTELISEGLIAADTSKHVDGLSSSLQSLTKSQDAANASAKAWAEGEAKYGSMFNGSAPGGGGATSSSSSSSTATKASTAASTGGSVAGEMTGFTRHASGLESVPYDGYPALLDKGERVQTAAEVARGGDTSSSNQPINITLQIPGLPDYIVRVVRNKALQGGFYGVPLGAH